MKKKLLIVILPLLVACTSKGDKQQLSKEVNSNERVVYLKTSLVVQDTKLLGFIDSFISRCQTYYYPDSTDIDNYIFPLFIYQNDFFTRVKISFIIPGDYSFAYTSLATGYFEYKGRLFILFTGLNQICAHDSTKQRELEILIKSRTRRNGRILRNGTQKGEPLIPFTWEADLVADTIFIRKGTINPFDPPPSDTAVLYKYIRSIKSFNRLDNHPF